MEISVISIICIAVSAAVSIGIPVFLFFGYRRKYDTPALPFILGIAGFVFAVLLQGGILALLSLSFSIKDIPVIYIIINVLMLGVFQETARFIAFNIMKVKDNRIGTGYAYGTGHGGADMILYGGIAVAAAITGHKPYIILLIAAIGVIKLIIQMAFSIMVFYAVCGKKMTALFPIAIVLHVGIEIPVMLYLAGVFENLIIIAVILAVCALFIMRYAQSTHMENRFGLLNLKRKKQFFKK